MKKRTFTDFLCEQGFSMLATIILTLMFLLFIGIIFFSLGLPMQIFYSIVGVGFVFSTVYSLHCLRKKQMEGKKKSC